MSIRIRHPRGTITFSLGQGADLAALQAFIVEECGIPRSEQELKTGYPPKVLSLHSVPATTPLSDSPLRIRKGEQIIVAVRSSSVSSAPSVGASLPATPSAPAAPSPTSTSQTASIPSLRSTPTATTDVLGTSTAEKATTIGNDTTTKAAPTTPASKAVATVPGSSQRQVPLSAAAAAAAASLGSCSPPSLTPGVKAGEVISIQLDPLSSPLDGHLKLQVVPDDNSCLFSSISMLLDQSYDVTSTHKLRTIVSSGILADEESYSEAVLGMTPTEYVSRITRDSTWGGGVELAILSSHFQIEWATMDVQNGVTHIFGQERGFTSRGYLVYSGIHYDALLLLPDLQAPLEFASTLFDTTQPHIIKVVEEAAQKLVQTLRDKRYYTDTAAFALRCGQCGSALKGEKEATQHAVKTGHTDFREYE